MGSLISNTAEKHRQNDFAKIFDAVKLYFINYLGNNPSSTEKVAALVDAKYISKPELYKVMENLGQLDLTPQEKSCAREAALIDALVSIEVKRQLNSQPKADNK
jgi:hypothetical protein